MYIHTLYAPPALLCICYVLIPTYPYTYITCLIHLIPNPTHITPSPDHSTVFLTTQVSISTRLSFHPSLSNFLPSIFYMHVYILNISSPASPIYLPTPHQTLTHVFLPFSGSPILIQTGVYISHMNTPYDLCPPFNHFHKS